MDFGGGYLTALPMVNGHFQKLVTGTDWCGFSESGYSWCKSDTTSEGRGLHLIFSSGYDDLTETNPYARETGISKI